MPVSTSSTLLVPLVLALTVVAPPRTHHVKPRDVARVAYDRFADRTSVQLVPQDTYASATAEYPSTQARLSASFTCPGRTVRAPDSVTFLVLHEAPVMSRDGKPDETYWSFPDTPSLALELIVDGQRERPGDMAVLRGDAAGARCRELGIPAPSARWGRTEPEVLELTVPNERLLDWLEARSTEGRVGSFEFCLQNGTHTTAERYRAFARYVRELGAGGAGGRSR